MISSRGPESGWHEANGNPTTSALELRGSTNSSGYVTTVNFENLNITFDTVASSNFNKKAEELGAGTIVAAGSDNAAPGENHLSFSNSLVQVNFELSDGAQYQESNLAYGVILRKNDNSLAIKNSEFRVDSNMGGLYLEKADLSVSGNQFIIESGSGIINAGESNRTHNSHITGGSGADNTWGIFSDAYYDDKTQTFASAYTRIVGVNGIKWETFRYSSSYIGSFNVDFVSDLTEIVARDSNGYFESTLAAEMDFWDPSNTAAYDEPISTIAFNGTHTRILNYQSGSNNIEQYKLNGSGPSVTGFHAETGLITFKNDVLIFAGTENIDAPAQVIGLDLTRSTKAIVQPQSLFSVLSLSNTAAATSPVAIAVDGTSSFDVNQSTLFVAAADANELGTAISLEAGASSQIEATGGLILGNISVASDSEFKLETNATNSAGLVYIGAICGTGATSSSLHLLNANDVWLVTENTTVSNARLENGATLSLVADDAESLIESAQTELGWTDESLRTNYENFGLSISEIVKIDGNYRTVKLEKFSTENANFRLRVSQDAQDTHDTIVFDETSESVNGSVDIVLSGTTEDLNFTEIAQGFIRQDSNSSTVTLGLKDKDGDGLADRYVAVKGGTFGWQLGFKGNTADSVLTSDDETLNTIVGTGPGDWLLVRTDDIPIEVADAVAFGNSASQAISWLDGLEDLRKRIGDVRNGTPSGTWAKAFQSKSRFSTSGFEQTVSGIHVGSDVSFSAGGDASWLTGASFRYSRADQEGLGEAAHGTSDMDEYAVKLYATYMHENGFFADIVAHAGWYDMDIAGRSNDYTDSYSADYGVLGTGLSVEVGKTFTFGEASATNGAWFMEPQIQLAYLHVANKDYRTSTGLKIAADDTNFLTGRIGFEAGRTFITGTNGDGSLRELRIAILGGMTHEFDGDTVVTVTGTDGSRSFDADDISGTRGYYGVSAYWNFSDSLNFYGRLAREQGNGYTKEYDFSVGLRYEW